MVRRELNEIMGGVPINMVVRRIYEEEREAGCYEMLLKIGFNMFKADMSNEEILLLTGGEITDKK